MKNEQRKMKNSGIEWIGEIPNDWNKIYGQYLYDIVTGKKDVNQGDLDGQYPFFTCSDDVKRINEYSFDCEALLVAGNGIVGNTKYYNGKFDAYQRTYVLYNFKKERINIEFLKIYLSNLLTISVETKTSGSVIEFIKLGDIKKFEIVYPDINRQERIAELLNKKIHNINSLIMNEEQQIEKLKEYKQSLITEVVTKGLDKNVEMKDSGVEWIGKIPKEWQLLPIKAKFKSGKGLPITKADLVEEGIKVISYGQIHAKNNISVEINNSLYRYVDNKWLKSNVDCVVKKGDFIFADTSEDVTGSGDFIYVNNDDLVFAGYHCLTLKPIDVNCNNKYLAYLFLSSVWKSQLQSKVCGVKLYSISKKFLMSTSIILPPINEQKEITNFLDGKCKTIEEVIVIKKEKIEKLNEYKKSLIYEYVTGKKEV